MALLESLLRTGPCSKLAYVLRACNPPKSIAEKIEETTFPPWSAALMGWIKDNKHSSEQLLRGLCPHLPEEELQSRILKLTYGRAKYLAKHGMDILDVKGHDNPWTVIALSEPAGETEAELREMIAGPKLKGGRPKLTPVQARNSRRKRRESQRRWVAARRRPKTLSGPA